MGKFPSYITENDSDKQYVSKRHELIVSQTTSKCSPSLN